MRGQRSLTRFSKEPRDGSSVKVSLFFFFLPFPLRPRPFFFPFPFFFRLGGGVSGSPWGLWEEDPSQIQKPSVGASPLTQVMEAMLAPSPLILCLEASTHSAL